MAGIKTGLKPRAVRSTGAGGIQQLKNGFDFQLRFAVCVVLVLCVVLFVLLTWRWPLVNDAAQLNYACFLMDHGMAPYRDLMELNMPGIYLVNWSVMHSLGEGDLAWRFFDFSLLGVAGLAMYWIAKSTDWLAALYSGSLLALFHGRDGPSQAGQRDLIILVLLLLGYALIFHAVRSGRNWPMFFFGLFGAGAVAIKPVALPFVMLVLLAAGLRLWLLKRPYRHAVLLALGGMAVTVAVVFRFLDSEGSLQGFIWIVTKVLPHYASLGRASTLDLTLRSIPPTIRVLALIAGAAAWFSRKEGTSEENWEKWMLLGGVAFGFFSYFVQGKAFPYHRYPMLGFMLLWVGIEFASGLKVQGIARKISLTGLVLGIIFAPVYLASAKRAHWDESFNTSLTNDLNHLGGADLSGKVQCFTTAADCDTVLYRMRLVQATGLMYDYLVFSTHQEPYIKEARRRVWQALQTNPPKVLVMTRGLFPSLDPDYKKLQLWPELDQELSTHYSIYDERSFAPSENGDRAYRIYLRNRDAP